MQVERGDSSSGRPLPGGHQTFAAAVERFGTDRAVPASSEVLVRSGAGQAQLTVRLDTAGDMPCYLRFCVESDLGLGWAVTTWTDLKKAPTLALAPGAPPPDWPDPPRGVLHLGMESDFLLGLMARYELVVMAWPSYPALRRLMFERQDGSLRVAAASPYQVAWEWVAYQSGGDHPLPPIFLPGSAFRPVEALLKMGLEPELGVWSADTGKWADGSYLRLGDFEFWSRDPSDFLNLSFADRAVANFDSFHEVKTTALDIRRAVRADKGEERDASIKLHAVTFEGVRFSRTALRAVGTHLRDVVTVRIPRQTSTPVLFTDATASHLLQPLIH